MTRGNQREINRARAEKKHAQHGGRKEPEGAVSQRKTNDAEIMRQKQQAAEARKVQDGDKKEKAKGNVFLQPNDNETRNKVTNQKKH